MLAFPTVLILFSAVAQVMILSQSRLYVEQAAYAAARSAMVYKCPPFDPLAAFRSPIAAAKGFSCTDRPEKWQNAARWALVAASPTSDFAKARGCPEAPAAGKQIVTAGGAASGLEPAVENAICYAFEDGNVVVSDPVWSWIDPTKLPQSDTAQISVKVSYKAPLSTPFRRFLSDGKHSNGTYWRWAHATVVLR